MWKFLAISIVAIAVVVRYYINLQDATNPVCIVGAGPAGLSAAARLEAAGRKLFLFEKMSEVGGKCQSIYDNDTFIPLGAFMYSNSTYRETQKIIDLVDKSGVSFASGQKWAYDWETGHSIQAPTPPPEIAALLKIEFVRYIQWWQINFAPYNQGARYNEPIPEEFTLSSQKWLEKHEYRVLPIAFSKIITAYGYGDFRYLPIIYMLQYLTPDVASLLLQVSQGRTVDIIDFHDVFVRFASSSIKGPILLETEITKIDRSGIQPVITYRTPRNEDIQYQECSDLIIAFPPTLRAMKAAGMDLTEEEQILFNEVKVNNYWSGALRTNIPYGVSLTARGPSPILPPDAVGQPVTIIKLQETSNITTVGSWAALDGDTTTSEARNILLRSLSQLNKDPGEASHHSGALSDTDIVSFEKMDYFPHFDSSHIQAGWYDKFQAVQGSNRTYWASGLNMFELVEYAVRAGQDVVDSYL